MRPLPIVAIDGPAGAGKSSVTREVANRLGYVYIDTGAMYRAVALAALRQGMDWQDGEALHALTSRLRMAFEPREGVSRLLLDDEDVSDAIRTPEISRGASQVSQWPGVRACLVELQRRIGEAGGVVMEGRDIGTVVFPEAEVKIYLTATPEERARRRCRELQSRGEQADEEGVLRDVTERDRRDSEREHSPLRKAEDAIEVVTDGMTMEQVVEHLVALTRERERVQP